MLFSADARDGLADGRITTTFRAWSRPQARTGGRYRVLGLLLEAERVEQVDVASITGDDAARAGEPSLDALLDRLGRPAPETLVWRVDLRCLGDDDRVALRGDADLAADEVEVLRARLARLDRASASGPWTVATLRLIDRFPGVVSTALARHAGRERQAFKVDVRKLKELGLTESLDVGYRLSPRGQALLSRL